MLDWVNREKYVQEYVCTNTYINVQNMYSSLNKYLMHSSWQSENNKFRYYSKLHRAHDYKSIHISDNYWKVYYRKKINW